MCFSLYVNHISIKWSKIKRKKYSWFIRKEKCSPLLSWQFDRKSNQFSSILFFYIEIIRTNYLMGTVLRILFVDVDIKLWFLKIESTKKLIRELVSIHIKIKLVDFQKKHGAYVFSICTIEIKLERTIS